MSWLYRRVIRPVLFSQNSEVIHDRTLQALAWGARRPPLVRLVPAVYGAPELPVDCLGLTFPNPVGLAAGMDKEAVALPMWEAFGFGFCEMGGVTWHAQPGNPKPRMFRAVSDGALVNRMGFNNGGALALASQLDAWRDAALWPAHPVGVNLGRSKVTPNDRAIEDYASSFKTLREKADFFVVNVSSPNTPNLRELQDRSALNAILTELKRLNCESAGKEKPLLVKIAPDLSPEALDQIAEVAIAHRLDGLVATNTTVTRPATAEPRSALVYSESGGLSGRPVRTRSTEVIRHLYRRTAGRIPIIGVGGIFSADDAWEKIIAGATLVQIYTGMVYEGPAIAGDIVRGLVQKLGNRSWSDVVGSAA
ncbi:MAG: quinone-dependent dihydroorotate dehydrogenase [Pedosphaera sp.]|nr:quinone-dependent dihydroorotate dehydrogenase [Pedosphaera sp.]